MKIAVIGAGAMGSIYGGHLSLHNDVCFVDTNQKIVEQINQAGLQIEENGTTNLYHPRAVIGTTEDNGAVLAPGHVRRGGIGKTNVGMLTEDKEGFLPKLKEAFDCCGFQVAIHENIQQLIWNKLFTNVSLSAVTGILQVDMGYIAANEYAWTLTRKLLHEAVLTAHAAGIICDEENGSRACTN